MHITAKLTKLTDYKQLQIELTQQNYDLLDGKIDKNNIWTWNREGVMHWYCKINLDRFDKAVIEKKFDPLVRKMVNLDIIIQTYQPEDGTLKTYLKLKKISLCKEQPKVASNSEPRNSQPVPAINRMAGSEFDCAD